MGAAGVARGQVAHCNNLYLTWPSPPYYLAREAGLEAIDWIPRDTLARNIQVGGRICITSW
jgi:hypothetical protein